MRGRRDRLPHRPRAACSRSYTGVLRSGGADLDAHSGNRQREGMTRLVCVALALALGLVPAAQGAPTAVVVSSKLSSESAMLGQMIRLLLNTRHIPTVDRTKLGATPVVRKALLTGEVDLYVEYTGNAAFFFNQTDNPAWRDLESGYTLGARLDYAANHIVWLTAARASNAWALAVRQDVATANHLATLTDFGRWVRGGGRVVLACSAEFANAGALHALERAYGFTLRSAELIVLAGGETAATIAAAAAATNGTNTAMVYGTDGGVVAAHLRLLEDDREVEPIYAPVPIVREAVLKQYPQIASLVKPLMESFSRETLQQLNARVQIAGEAEETVAGEYLRTQGLIR
jgi:osmoprotectant transport system substrate-binding protein